MYRFFFKSWIGITASPNEHTALRSNGKHRICICTTNTRFPCKAPLPQVMSSTHHRTWGQIYLCCPVYDEKWSASTNYLCKRTKTQRTTVWNIFGCFWNGPTGYLAKHKRLSESSSLRPPVILATMLCYTDSFSKVYPKTGCVLTERRIITF